MAEQSQSMITSDRPAQAGPADGAGPPPTRRGRIGSLELLVVGLVVLMAGRQWLAGWFTAPGVQAWATVFVAICVQAVPFLVLGTLLSAAITALVPASFLQRALPRRPVLAVPAAGLAGAVLPGCECASVPVADGLMARGVAPAAALAFLLSAPAINPVVLTATAVAFPGRPEVVLARFAASLVTAVVVGWLWARFGRPEWLRPSARRERPDGEGRWTAFRGAFVHEFLHASGFLVIGGITAATLNVVVPRQWLGRLAGLPGVSVLVLALLAVVLAVCSEADAFVAASLSAFPLAARLAFMVVGPMVDVKLVAMQAGTFGWSFAWRFSATTLTVAVAASALAGWWLL
ncbi:permease [Kitasatospora sp. RB6PN24]|uniref:permease n=1 Tax=Kitasatospora humi TaxID=2893891 RepID=UPI001E60EDC6|nr:permease [Kitasatospora humi]MCC9305794.1 permease [Kitasatospora humi]